MDRKAILAALFRRILEVIGEDPDREGLRETETRAAKAMLELCRGVGVTEKKLVALVKRFTEVALSDQIVVVRNINFASLCEHHLLQFEGVAHVAYIPNDHGVVPGLSKVARVLDILSRRPQVQERLTTQLFDVLQKAFEPNALMVILKAKHHCMCSRGVNKPNADTLSMKTGGLFKTDPHWCLVAKELVRGC